MHESCVWVNHTEIRCKGLRTPVEQLPLADVLRRTRHVYGLSLSCPLYLDGAAVHRYAHRALGEAAPRRRHRRCARARPRGERLAGAALPDPHPDAVRVSGVDELDVGLLGEEGIVLYPRT